MTLSALIVTYEWNGANAFLNLTASSFSSASLLAHAFQSIRCCRPNRLPSTILNEEDPLVKKVFSQTKVGDLPAKLQVKVPLQHVHHLGTIRALHFKIVSTRSSSRQRPLRLLLPIDTLSLPPNPE